MNESANVSREAKRHRLLVVGVGSIGERHVRCFQRTNRVDIGICEIDQSLRTRVAERYRIDEAFDNLPQALLNPWDAAVIATPADTHIELAARLSSHQIALLIEKPLATREAFANGTLKSFCQKVRTQQLPVAVAYVLRLHPVVARLSALSKSESLGSPLQLTIQSGQHFPTYRPAYRDTYYTNPKTGGGAIQDALPHLLNLCSWLTTPIQSIACDAQHLVLEDVAVEDTVHVMARHEAIQSTTRPIEYSPMSVISLNQHQAPNEVTITLVMERGTLRGELHNFRCGKKTTPEGAWIWDSIQRCQRDYIFEQQADCFLDYVEQKRGAHCTLQEAQQTLAASLTALDGAQSSLTKLPADMMD